MVHLSKKNDHLDFGGYLGRGNIVVLGACAQVIFTRWRLCIGSNYVSRVV